MRNRLLQFLTVNTALKITALVIACVIWLFVTNSSDPVDSQLFTNVPITIVNQDSIADIGKVVEPRGSGTVSLRVTERSSVLRRLSRTGSDFYVEADLENMNDMNSVPLTATCTNSSVTWDEIDINPSSLKVTLENKVEQEFPVTISTTGTPSSGFEVGSTAVTQGKTLLIAGPESIINIISQVAAPVNVAALTENTTLTSALRVYDKNGAVLSEAQMSRLEFKDSSGRELQNAQVNVRVTIWRVRSDIALRVETEGEPAEGYQVTKIETIPQTTSLAGTQDALDEVGRYLLVEDSINVEGASENIRTEIDLTDTISQYTNLRLMDTDNSTISVEVVIEKTGDHTYDLPLSNVELLNRPTDMKLVFTPADLISVSVHAQDEAAGILSPEDIEASMDLLVCAREGNYTIPVNITLPDGYELNRDVTVRVSATATGQNGSTDATIRPAESKDE